MQQRVDEDEPLIASALTQVERFQREVIGQPIPDRPTPIEGKRKQHCAMHLGEELREFIEATTVKDQADAMIDLAYVALGRLVEMGVLPRAAFEAVHERNMLKKQGTRAKRPDSGGLDAVASASTPPVDWGRILGFGVRDLMRVSVRRPKLLVLGHARHGKDTVCELLRDNYGYAFTSSSRFLLTEVVWPAMRERYIDEEACFADRSNHRAEWYELLRAYNTPDAGRLGRALLRQNDAYCGLRSSTEFHALRNAGAFDFCIWVDASHRTPPEPRDSCTVEQWMADVVVDNNRSLELLPQSLAGAMDWIGRRGA